MMDMVTVSPRFRAGIVGESTNDEAYGVLSGEDRLVREIMTRTVVIADSSMLLEDAGETIRNQKMSILVVYEGGEPAHALTELDLTSDNIGRESHSSSGTLQEITKCRVSVRCHEDAILADAMHAMIKHRTSHVPVVDSQGGIVGALSLVNAIGAISPPAAELWSTKMRGWSVTPPPSQQ